MDNYVIGVLGNQQVGRSTLINHYIPNAIKIGEPSNTDINYYKVYGNTEKQITFVDTRSVFNQNTTTGIGGSNNVEYILRQIKDLDYIIFCISVTKHGIREQDLRALGILHESLRNVRDRIFVYITKTDLLSDYECKKFIKTCEDNRIVGEYKIFSEKDIGNISTSFIQFLTSKFPFPGGWYNLLEQEYKISAIC